VQQSNSASATGKTFSIYAKAGTNSFLQIYFATDFAPFANFDLTNGTVGSTGTATTASIISVGNGWYRCIVSTTSTTATTPVVQIVPASTSARGATSTLTTSVLIWGAQAETGTTATDYTRNAGGVFPPRFDYDPVTLAPRGLLIEEQRTNFYTYSSDFTNAAWIKNLLNLTAGADIGPDGTTSATLIAANAGGNANIYSNYTGTGVQYTGSIWIKAGTSSTANINLYQNGIGVVPMTMTIISGPGTIGAVSSSNGPITGLSSTQWTRVAVTSTGALTGNVNFYVKPNSGSVSNLGDSVYIYGAQLEAGAFATSYIPTVASQVTRAADVAAITGPNFTPWYNQSAGTFVVEGSRLHGGNSYAALAVARAAGGITERIDMGLGSGQGGSAGVFRDDVVVGGVNQAALGDFAAFAANTPYRGALAYAANDFASATSGANLATDASGTVPTVALLDLGNRNSGNFLNGHIRSIRFYPSRLTNAQLQALTA
jgi:hypothetical protein